MPGSTEVEAAESLPGGCHFLLESISIGAQPGCYREPAFPRQVKHAHPNAYRGS